MLFIGCQSEEPEMLTVESKITTTPNPIKNVVIQDLKTDQQQRNFLSDLFDHDQYLRKNSPATAEFGYNSPGHKSYYKKLKASDLICLEKATQFLDIHGFPDPEKHGPNGYMGIIYVLHHSSKDNLVRHKYLPIFYEAYQEGKIDESHFDFYLGRMYDFEFGKRLKMESPFKSADRIAKYMEAFEFPSD